MHNFGASKAKSNKAPWENVAGSNAYYNLYDLFREIRKIRPQGFPGFAGTLKCIGWGERSEPQRNSLIYPNVGVRSTHPNLCVLCLPYAGYARYPVFVIPAKDGKISVIPAQAGIQCVLSRQNGGLSNQGDENHSSLKTIGGMRLRFSALRGFSQETVVRPGFSVFMEIIV
ncbi:hypothetical protein AGMMS50256_19330 [Betaproteobacteria bacterium]|nr:hypothetical protein AGMMS50256_19330 [Betaproteobacteria bacterium]